MDQQLERRVGALEGGAFRLELLDQLRERARIDHAVELVAELLGAPSRVDAAAELGDHQTRLVADKCRVDVLIGVPDARRGRAVDAALVRERADADVRLVVVRHDVGHLRHEGGQLRQAGQVGAAMARW